MKPAAFSAGVLLAAASLGAQTFAITGGTVHTLGAAGTIERGTVLIRDGKIAAVGASVAIPADAVRIDASGKIVTPGLFDPKSRFGIEEVSQVDGTRDDAAKGKEFTAALDVAPAINPRSMLIPVNRIAGVTTAADAPSVTEGGTIVAGRGAVITLGSTEGYLLKDPAAMYVTLCETGSDLAGGSRVAALLHLREALEDARDYLAHRAAFDEARRRPYRLGRLDLAAFEPVLKREIPIVVSVQRASDIEAVLALAREFGLSLVIDGGAEAWMVAGDLAKGGVPVILNPLVDLPWAFEGLGATLENAGRLAKAGVVIAFETGDSHNARNMTQLAGNAVAYGLPWGKALAAITVNPAKIYGMAARTGTLEPGKSADVVVWSGDPLEVTSAPVQVFIRGEKIPMTSRQTLLRDRYLELLRGRGTLPPEYDKPAER
ncbi:MAG TPA: amidohydrolase family protein [Thermoanaerobaculia bacterium]|nr:amidohydrolase family protein [Thermoanaerobaculia bacterium]